MSLAVYAGAQNSYDVMKLADSDIAGTARFVGMGGAMSALGADISVAGTNPAGIALYRSNDFVFSAGLNTVDEKSNFMGTSIKNSKNSFDINNIGMVISSKWDSDDVKFVNLAFNYRHRNNFDATREIAGSLTDRYGNFFSQQKQLHQLYENGGDYAEYYGYDDYTSFSYPWLGLLTSTSGLVDEYGNLCYVPGAGALYPTSMYYYSEEKGGVDEVDFTMSCNVSDRFYLGLTFGASNVDYTRYSEYTEHCSLFDYYTLQNSYNISGNGFNMKLGAIVRPFEYSPFRVGLSLHTPTWYSLIDCSSATMIGTGDYEDSVWDTRGNYAYGDDLLVEYNVTTPWRLNVSAAYTFGKSVAIDAEYELVDYSTASIEFADGKDIDELNSDIESNMRAQHIFRVGALFNLADDLSLRCGYNHITAPFEENAGKSRLLYSDTSTDYMNKLESDIYTLGFGYSGDGFYFDMAYKLTSQRSHLYTYYDSECYNPYAEVKSNRHSFVATMGFRF